jgi:hypothetical protein
MDHGIVQDQLPGTVIGWRSEGGDMAGGIRGWDWKAWGWVLHPLPVALRVEWQLSGSAAEAVGLALTGL